MSAYRPEDLVAELRAVAVSDLMPLSEDLDPLLLRAAAEIERLRDALRMIAEESVCPDLWRPEARKDWSEGELAHRTALVIARAALEPATERKAT